MTCLITQVYVEVILDPNAAEALANCNGPTSRFSVLSPVAIYTPTSIVISGVNFKSFIGSVLAVVFTHWLDVPS
jgi:hypothetical protein